MYQVQSQFHSLYINAFKYRLVRNKILQFGSVDMNNANKQIKLMHVIHPPTRNNPPNIQINYFYVLKRSYNSQKLKFFLGLIDYLLLITADGINIRLEMISNYKAL